jgi:hypothetical protein
MKRQIILGTMLSTVIAAGVAAQQPPASGDPASRPAQSSDSAQTITVTGCLAAASAGASTAPGAASPSAGGFELKNATTGTMAKGSSPAGAPGASPGATGTSGAAGTTYKLVGGDSEDLQKNVGKKVEVTGSVAARGASSPSASPTGSPAGAASGSASAQSFQVKSIRATGDSCNP